MVSTVKVPGFGFDYALLTTQIELLSELLGPPTPVGCATWMLFLPFLPD